MNAIMTDLPEPGQPPTSKAAVKLAAAAQAAAEVRNYQTDPDVVAYKIERTNAWTMRLIWTGLILGLAFTAVNVQQFAAGDADWNDPAWWTAWLLDPMVSLILIGVLIGEQNIARHVVEFESTKWIRVTKWTALLATYSMNTWASWEAGHADAIVLHSVPPLMVVCAAEAVTDLRHLVTQAVHDAHTAAVARAHGLALPTRTVDAYEPESVRITRTDQPRTGDRTEEVPPALPDARMGDARTGVDVPPVETPIERPEAQPMGLLERAVVVQDLAAEILTAMADGEKWSPDYPALMACTGFRRSWCEKVVREARELALRTDPDDGVEAAS